MQIKYQIKILILLFSLLFSNLVLAENTVSNTAKAEVWDSKKIMKPLLDGVRRFTLPNGLKVVFYRRPHAPVFSGQIWVKVGGVNEQINQTGSAHMLEHMAFKGSETIGTKDYGKEKGLLQKLDRLESKGKLNEKELKNKEKIKAKLNKLWENNEFSRIYEDRGGVGLNAATSKDYTYYMVDLPNNAFELWAWMESDRLLKPVFRQFYEEKEVVREERRMRSDDDPNGKLYEQMVATAFLVHPNRFPIIGWPSDLKNLEKEVVEHVHRTYYRPDNMVISLVGDLDFDTVKTTIEKYFSRLEKPKTKLPVITTEEEPQKGQREVVVIDKALPRAVLAYHKPVYPNPDDMKFTVLHSVLGDGRSSIFFRRFIEGKKIASSVSSSEAPGELYPSVFYIWAVPKKGVSNRELITEIDKVIEELKKNQIPQADIEAAKKRIRVSLLGEMASSHGLAQTLGHAEVLWGDWRKMLDMYDITFNVTSKDLQDLAIKYLTVQNRTVARLENAKNE